MYQYPLSKELIIVKNNKNIKVNKNNFIDYKNKICIKPWGYEFLIYMNDKIGIWFIKILKNQQTSIHTHFNKDTLLITFKGTGKINFIDDKCIILNEMEFIYIPKYKFHGLSSFSDYTYFIEIEIYNKDINFTDKNDLLRIQDIYNRDNIGYESSINISEELTKYNYFYLSNDIIKNIDGNIIKFTTINTNSFENKNNLVINNKYLNILINGELYYNNIIYKEGSIITTDNNTIFESVEMISLYSSDKLENKKIIYSLDHLKILLQTIKENKIILTSGCFDIIHVGHLKTLKQASELGDILMVCLSSDEQIRKIKGEDRPINSYEDRINLFKTIKYVDYIILYDEENIEKEQTLDNIMKIIDPYAWVKGSDYTKEDILLKHSHLSNIILLDNIDNISTTNIINKIKNI